MKISTFVMVILAIAGVISVFVLMTQEAATNYPAQNINTESWSGSYDYSSEINETISPLQETFSKIEDENTGWFTKLTSGIAAIPLAVIRIPVLLFKTFSIGGSLVLSSFAAFHLPLALAVIVGVMILVWGIFKLIEIYQRWQV